MKFASLASGSKQNCFYLEAGSDAILIDAGLSITKVEDWIPQIGGDISKLKAILVTHEHYDHTKSLRSVSRNLDLPIYMNEDSKNKIHLKLKNHESIYPNLFFKIGDIDVLPFKVKHDAICTLGFKFIYHNEILMHLSDIGVFNHYLTKFAADVNFLSIEANYDTESLEKSLYPRVLKDRISSPLGHLSICQSFDFIEKVKEMTNPKTTRLKTVLFNHLSANSNSPELLQEKIDQNLSMYTDLSFNITSRDAPTDLFEF